MLSPDDKLEVILDLQFRFTTKERKAQKGPWYKNKTYFETIFDIVAEMPLYTDAKVAGRDEKWKPFKTIAEAKKLVLIGRDEWTTLRDVAETHTELKILFQPFIDDFNLKIRCSGSVLEKHRDTLIDQYVVATQRLHAAFSGIAGLAMGCILPGRSRSNRFEYPRPRPPWRTKSPLIYAVADFIDLRFHASKHEDARPFEAEAMTSAEPPPPARRFEKGKLVVIQWARAAALEELQRAAGAREQWVPTRVPAEREVGFNDLGDRWQTPGTSARPKPPLTSYWAKYRTGYQVVDVAEDGRVIDADAWNAAKRIFEQRKLDDESPVERMVVVAPSRKTAFVIAEEAKRAGFVAAYRDDDGRFWSIDPEGMWLTPPLGS